MMIPATMARPAPPSKRNSNSSNSRNVTSSISGATSNQHDFLLSASTPNQLQTAGHHSLLHKLSSSSLCTSLPPDSPPTTFDDQPPLPESSTYFQSRHPPTRARAPRTIDQSDDQPAFHSDPSPWIDATDRSKENRSVSPTASIRRARGNGMTMHQRQLDLVQQHFNESSSGLLSSKSGPDSRALAFVAAQSSSSSPASVAAAAPAASSSTLPWSSISSLDTRSLNETAAASLNRATTKSMASLKGRFSASDDFGPTPHSLPELEKMLEDADLLIRTKEQELSIFTAAGEGLLQEYNTLRTRHDALLGGNSTPSTSSDAGMSPTKPSPSMTRRPSAVSRTSSGTSSGTPFGWSPRQLSLGFGVPPPSTIGIARSDQSSTSNSAPWTQVKSQEQEPDQRQRTDSNASSNFFSPSSASRHTNRLSRSNYASPMNARDVYALNSANEVLTQQLTELEADSEKADREGRKKLRKLERELSELRQELRRVESVNESLKVQADADIYGSKALKQSVRDKKERDELRSIENNLHQSRSTDLRRSSFSDGEGDLTKKLDFAPSAGSLPTEENFSSHEGRRHNSSPPNVKSASGSPVEDCESLDVEIARAKQQAREAEEAQKAQDFVVQKLMEKIEELQETNDIITNERVEMEQRLRVATVEVDEFKKRCEELEEMVMMENIEWNDRRGITWRDDLEDERARESPDRVFKGNQRVIVKQRRRRAGQWRSSLERSFSLRSGISATSSRLSDESPSKSAQNGNHPRTLGSELGGDDYLSDELDRFSRRRIVEDSDVGSVLDHQRSLRDLNENNSAFGIRDRDDEDDDEVGNSSQSTSMPTPQRPSHSRFYSERTARYDSDDDGYESPPAEDTSRPLFPRGSLRLSGPPDNVSYEQMDRTVTELPAVWEDEGHGIEPPTPHRVGRVGGRLLQWVEAEHDASEDDDELWSRYPEEDHFTHAGLLESREAVEAKSTAKCSPSSMRRRKGRRGSQKRGGRVVSDRLRDVFDEDDDAEEDDRRLTRRQMALRRMGLDDDVEYSGSEQGSFYDEDYNSEDGESVMTDFELLDADRRMRHGDYYPVSLRARYAPRMVIARITDSAMQHLVNLITYVRFFALLAIAVTFALWQGPKRTLGDSKGTRRRPRRIQ